jgi:hypothetical protein
MKKLLLLLSLLTGCGKSWDLDRPIRVAVLSPVLSTADITKYFDNAVRQLGGTTSSSADQVVYVSYNFAGECQGCTPFTFEHVAYNDDLIQILPHIRTLPEEALEHAITHGLGHVLGYAAHLPAGRKGVMMPVYDYVPQPRSQYTADDLAAIATGRVVGGVF